MKIKITTPSTGSVAAELTDENPETVKALVEALPITGRANLWGDEIYFSIPVDAPMENTKTVVELGDLAYWPPGNAFCIFFGQTPMSSPGRIVPASAVNIIGNIIGDPGIFREVMGEDKITVKAIDQ